MTIAIQVRANLFNIKNIDEEEISDNVSNSHKQLPQIAPDDTPVALSDVELDAINN